MKKPFQFLTAMLVCFILISGGCDDKQQNTETKPQTNMNPSNKSNYNLSDYDTAWKKVDSLERQGLLKSALEVVNSIMERAQKEDNQPVQIKGFIYQLKYNQSLEENDFSNALTRIDKMRLTAKAPVKQILASIKGEMLWMYYTNNRYNFYNRSTTTNFDLGDVSTWDLKTLLDTSFKLYEESLLDASQLQQIPTSNFDYIITKKDSTAYLNAPTIYDFLANRALSFFENDETGITRPGEKFKVNDDSYFGNSTVFSQIKLESKDTMSTHLHYIQVMQELTRFHQSEKYPTAQLRNELRRLKFVYNKSTIANKDELYEQALKTLQTSFKENPVFSEINAHLAQHYYNLGASSEANSPHYSKIKEAYDLCEKTIAQYPKTSGATFCSSLITNIQQPYLAAQIEKYTASKTPILTKISYNNLSKVTVQIYKKNSSDDTYYYELKDKLKNTKLIESKEYDLPKITNFQKQTTEIALNELEHGNYIILVSTNPEKIDDKQYNHWAADFQITDMSFSLRGINSKKSALQVFDRTTSVGIANATVHVYETKYNYTTRKSERRKIASYKTDAKGYAAIDHFDDRYGKYIEVVNGKDQLTSSAHLSNYTYQQDTYQTDNLFTDRSIYRPGQTVYFKGIRLETVNKKSKIKSDASVKAIFKDVNYQEVSSLQLKTNDFGSFEGSFRIPTTGITGQMTIQTEHGMVYFSVEEYKRPTFKVEIEKSKEEYKLGDIIAVKGKAVAYAGNAIDDAQVSYVVKRQLIMPYWCRYYYGITPINSEQTIIKEGAIKTNQQGAFDLKFKSEKDNSSHSKYLNYVYTIEVDVTDANGETRSTLKHLTISESSMNLSVSMKESLEKNEKNSIQVNALNAEGQEINASGTIIISKLKSNAEVLRSRVWDFPSKPLLSDAEYKKLFPNMELKTIKQDEREIEATIPRLYFNTEKSSTVELNTSNWKTGEYKIEFVATDKDGNEVKNVQYVTVTDSKSTSVPFGSIFHAYTLKSTFEPGETATVVVASSMMNQKVIAELNVDGVIVDRKEIILSNEQKTLNYPILESYRGGVSVHLHTIRFGQSFVQNFDFNVPYSNKELTVNFETFRDKLLPGKNEEWRLRISGPKKEKVASELLLTMYDESLDAFKFHGYYFNPYRSNAGADYLNFVGFGYSAGQTYYSSNYRYISLQAVYPTLNWFGYYLHSNDYYYIDGVRVRGARTLESVTTTSRKDNLYKKGTVANYDEAMPAPALKEMEVLDIDANNSKEGFENEGSKPNETDVVPLRSNFNETAFFFPQLKTDANGDILVTFTVPESLTSWKVLGLAHTKDLEFALFQKNVVTQKDLMIQSNVPRFVRHGDEVVLTSKISNLTDGKLSGTSYIEILDGMTMKRIEQDLGLTTNIQNFEVDGKQSTVVSWNIKAVEDVNNLIVRVYAKTENHSDGEEQTIPVLTDKVLVTESLPLTNNGKGSKMYEFTKLVNSNTSSSLKHHAVTLEYTSNPAWYVIQALPYMLEYPYECSEQTFTRFYANAIASNIVRSSPKIKEVFDKWKTSSPSAFLSNLEKNQALKSVILEETPWILNAQNESERKKRVALLFDFNKMDNELSANLKKLVEAQVSNGGFPWFPGMPESRYITQYIVSGMGHLDQLNIVSVKENKDVQKMIQKAVKYLDSRMLEDYNEIKKRKDFSKDYMVSQNHIQYLYARSFFTKIKLSNNEQEAFDFFKNNAQTHWLKYGLNNQVMLALASHRLGESDFATNVMKSVVERSITTEEMGMYWKENERGYYWYQAPIETQALIIEALHTISQDVKACNNAKIWLLRNKQTSDWKTTTATANAAYALLIGGNAFTDQSEQVTIEVGGKVINPADFGAAVEAGTGYFQTSWTGKEVSADLGKIKVTRNTEGFSYGAMYWQYYESMEKVTSAETSLKLKKQLFVVRQTSSGEVIAPIKDTDRLKKGEKVRVRIELVTDRNMEFVHMKDYRAAGFEPINVLSSYKRQGRLGYYENTRDVATHFFFDYLPKGTYVFEYDLRVSHTGNFTNGFATIQCMYAPEFTSHSNGVRVVVE